MSREKLSSGVSKLPPLSALPSSRGRRSASATAPCFGSIRPSKTGIAFRLNLLLFLTLSLAACRGEKKAEPPPPEALILPYREDAPHLLTRAYTTGSHRRYFDSDERFAIDLAMPGCEGFRAEVVAPLSGRVTYGDGLKERGKNILIARPDGLTCRLAHLDRILVPDGAEVAQGALVGLEGDSGTVGGTKCPTHPGTHLHLACYSGGEGVRPEPISGYRSLEQLRMQPLYRSGPPPAAGSAPTEMPPPGGQGVDN